MNPRNNYRAFKSSGGPGQQLADPSHARGQNRTRSIQLGGREKLRNHGFTLVELMVAMTIGLIILAAVATIFGTSRSTYVLEEGLARVQEAGRFGAEFITTDVRMAGYIGCANANTTTVQNHLNSPTSYGTNHALGQYIYGHTYTGTTGGTALSDWTPALPGSPYFSAGDVQPYTDVVVVRRASETGVTLGVTMSDTSADLKIDSNPGGLVNNDIVMISDCSNADLLQITGPASMGAGTNNLVHNTGAGSPGNTTKPLSKAYGPDAQVMKLTTRIYYIGKRSGAAATDPPSLFRKDMGTSGAISAQELVEGVEKMKVVYGVDTELTPDNTPNIYKTANNVAASEWSKVVSVRFGLLVRTTSKVDQTADTKPYTLVGQAIGAPFNDNFRRQVYTSTVQLRNLIN
ncbi:MAG: PilW family protein [Sulfuricaulis sp.]|nr:PilW family protein [Sulfuricaulis sp.]